MMPAGLSKASKVRSLLEASVLDNVGDSLLLSGGLDTTIIANIAASRVSDLGCRTVKFSYGLSPDIPYAKRLASKLGLKWKIVSVPTGQKLGEKLQEVTRILKTFDPMETRNSLTVFIGMQSLADSGYKKVMTGDAADELFAGYDFIHNLSPEELKKRLRQLWAVMQYSSKSLAVALGMEAKLPYLDPRITSLAKRLQYDELVGTRNGEKYGKYILRVAFEGLIGKRAAWRVKTPIEFGSGTTSLTRYFENKISDQEFASKTREILRDDGVKIRDKEHLAYYQFYRKVLPPPKEGAKSELRCPGCGADAKEGAIFCTVCGAYPIKPLTVAA